MCILWFLVHSEINGSAVLFVPGPFLAPDLAGCWITYAAFPKKIKTMTLQLGISQMHAE